LFRAELDTLRSLPLVGDIRGAGHFWAVELVKDKVTRETFSAAECEWLFGEVLSGELWERGLLCRLDDRGDPVIQLSPPLVADMALIHDIVQIVGDSLVVAGDMVAAGRTTAA
jgi:adenosylmethionine-8-amino-7-oxononanoate aminotransferase